MRNDYNYANWCSIHKYLGVECSALCRQLVLIEDRLASFGEGPTTPFLCLLVELTLMHCL